MIGKTPFKLDPPGPLLIVLSGLSGAGKDAVIQEMHKRGSPIHFVITATSREIRDGEKHGVDYFFMTTEEFETMIRQNELIEYALVYGQYKGVPKQQVREVFAAGKDVVMRVDVQGAKKIRELCPEAVLIFLTLESEEEMARRLKERGTDSLADINVRIDSAHDEYGYIDLFDYIVVNRRDRLDETVDTIEALIKAEHHRVKQRKVTL